MNRSSTASIIIPAYNAASCLGRALDSCLAQTLVDIEILIIDDGSRDLTPVVAQEYARRDKRVSIVTSDDRLGPAGARNLALRNATGRWIALLDADDAYDPKRLEILVNDAETRDCDLLADNLRLRDRASGSNLGLAFDPRRMAERRPLTRQEFLALDNSRDFWALGFCKPIIRREFLVRNGITYDTAAWVGQDFVIYFCCLTLGARFYLSDVNLYEFTVGGPSHSSGADGLQGLLQTNSRLLLTLNILDKHSITGLKGRQARLAYELLKQGLRVRSIKLVIRALRWGSTNYTSARLIAAVWKRTFNLVKSAIAERYQ